MKDSLFVHANDIGIGTGARGTFTLLLGNEIVGMFIDMRWGLILLLLLIIADYRYGTGESLIRYSKAKKDGNEVIMELYRFHSSRAWRRTINKGIDYILLMTLFGSLGMSVLEPVGVSHIWGCWAGAVVAARCEIKSIFGHFFFLRGVEVKEKTIKGFFDALLIAFAKRKNEDVGSALEEAMNKTKEEENGNERTEKQ